MTRLMHSCDVLIAPNHAEEGFGLPAAEAMASGIPVVMTSIPSYLSFDDVHDYALFAPEENAVELGEKLIEVLRDYELRERLRARGREVAEQWRAERVAERLEKALLPSRGEEEARTFSLESEGRHPERKRGEGSQTSSEFELLRRLRGSGCGALSVSHLPTSRRLAHAL